MFSKTCEYGIRASIFIAMKSYEGKRVSPQEISEEINSPKAFTAKILQALVKNNIVSSVQGAYGGFEIDLNRISNIKLSHIVNAIDGSKMYVGCGLGLDFCNENHPCPVHDEFKTIRENLRTMLENSSLEDLASSYQKGITFLKS